MKEFEVKIKVVEATDNELPEQLRKLVDTARQATERSYAPFSNFHVGAALLLSNGEIISGSNQENAAYPSGTCAERTCAFYAHSTYPQEKFVAIAVAARDTSGEFVDDPVAPCGACRQVLLEFEKTSGQPVRVILCGKDRVFMLDSVQDLLPLAFVDFD
ncbi:MAG: cytidine deaminase [Bacteroidales bacterium]|nr:cytidine deaminase [Bacteroidales bacterium]